MDTFKKAGCLIAALTLISTTAGLAQETCAGDCNEDGSVTVNELVLGVNINLGRADVSNCPAIDTDGNMLVAINELIAAVRSNLDGCGGGGATFADVQAILTAECAVPGCHSGAFPSNDLNLEDGQAYDQLVGVEPFNLNARNQGLLRVDPGDAQNSYLLRKVAGGLPLSLGSQMPLFDDPLTESEVATIRDWIDAGAEP
jgi:hypothetical protein